MEKKGGAAVLTRGHVIPALPKETIQKRLYSQTCFVCGSEMDEYNPRERGHDVPLGMGGSEALDVEENQQAECGRCHRDIHAGRLRLVHDDAGDVIGAERVIKGAWVPVTVHGLLKAGGEVSVTLFQTTSITEFLGRLQGELSSWQDEALREQYRALEAGNNALFSAKCYIVHILAQRRSADGKTHGGLKEAAKYLGIAYYTARVLHAIYLSILSKVPPDTTWQALGPEFFYQAYRAIGAQKIDPVAALNRAEEKVLANSEYTAAWFARDLKAGFPEEAPARRALIFSRCPWECARFKTAPEGSRLMLLVNDVVVATAPGGGQRYCEQTRQMFDDLKSNRECIAFEERPW